MDKGGFRELWQSHELAALLLPAICSVYLLYPFCSKLRRLLALDSQGRDWQNQIALFEGLCPLEGRVNDRSIDASDLRQNFREMCSIDINWVDLWITIGVFLQRCSYAQRFELRG